MSMCVYICASKIYIYVCVLWGHMIFIKKAPLFADSADPVLSCVLQGP